MSLQRRHFLRLAAGAALSTAAFARKEASFKIGITNNTRGGWEKDFLLACRECAEVGYKYIETFFHFVKPWLDKPQELRAFLDQHGLKLETVSNGGPMVMSFEEASKRGQIIEELKFGVHAHLWTQFQDRNEIDAVMELTDPRHVYFILDTGQINMAGIDPVELTKAYVGRIIEYHLKDTKPEHRGGLRGPLPTREQYMKEMIFFELGSGGVDFPGILAVLKKNAWQGWLTVELDESRRGPKESARISKDYIEKVLKLKV